MTKYTCPEKGCDKVIDGNDTIYEVLEHEKIHYKEKKMVKKTTVKKCTYCNGTGKIEETFMVEEDVPKTD